jgi:hypothetical protein
MKVAPREHGANSLSKIGRFLDSTRLVRAFDTLAEKSMIMYSVMKADLRPEANYVGKRENKRICSRTWHRTF